MNINLHQTHFSYIRNMKLYARSHLCRKCGDSLWKQPNRLAKHEMTCEGDVRRVYKGGVYHPTPSMFQRLDDEGIHVVDILRFYPYRATFDFECFFDETNLPTDTDHLQWVARHIPLSVNVASNVPGYEAPRCFVTDGDSNKLVNTMMTNLQNISDAAFEALKPSYENELEKLKTLKEAWDHVESEYRLEKNDDGDERESNDEGVEGDKKKVTTPFKTLMGQLFRWLQQLPVIGFNSGKYDINVIKRFFIPYLLTPSEDEDEDKSCLNTVMCFRRPS